MSAEPTTVQVMLMGYAGLAAAFAALWRAYREALKESRQRELDLLRRGNADKRAYMARLEENGQVMQAVQQGVRSQREVLKVGFRALDARMAALEQRVGEALG